MVYSPTMPNMKLDAQDMGAPNYQQALQDVFKNVQGSYDTAYKPKNMAEALLQAQLQNKHDQIINKYLPQSEEARIGNTEANTGYTNQQSKYYGRNIESEMALRAAQVQQAERETNFKKAMQDAYFSQPQSSSNVQVSPGNGLPPYAQNMQNSLAQQPNTSGITEPFLQIAQMHKANESTPYGIQIPQPTSKDLASKMLFNIDTYGDTRKQAIDQIKEERDKYSKKSQGIDNELAASNKHGQLLDRYNQLMDDTFLSGPFGSKVKIPTAHRQEIQALSRDMILSGIEELKNAMGSARFSNLDLQTATARKPDISWTPEARHEYTERFKAFNERLNEHARFNQLASNPSTGISSNMADRLWSAYQKHHPIVADAKTLALNKYKPNNWARYLTPEAINAIKETGDYNPKDKGLTSELSHTEQKILKNYSLEDLEKQLAEKRRRAKK